MKSRSSACPQQIGNFRPAVGFKIISVTELMMRSEKPACVRLDALERADVVLQVDMPARSVSVFLSFRVRWQWIQVRFLPETFRQRRKSQAGIELLRRLNNPFCLTALEVFVNVSGFNQTWPFLRPPIVDPVRRNSFRDRLMIFLGQLVLRPGMQLQIKGAKRRHPVV